MSKAYLSELGQLCFTSYMEKLLFEKEKETSLSHQLIKVGRLVNQRGLSGARETFNLPDLKQTHLDLFPYIDFEGTCISEIAKRKGVSKQFVSKLVQEMIQMKLLFLKPDSKDGRLKLVFFNTSGPFSIQSGLQILMSIDVKIKEQLGEKTYKILLENISRVLDVAQAEV